MSFGNFLIYENDNCVPNFFFQIVIASLLIRKTNCDTQYIYGFPQPLSSNYDEFYRFPHHISQIKPKENSQPYTTSTSVEKNLYYCRNNAGEKVPCANGQEGQNPILYGKKNHTNVNFSIRY